MFSRRLGHEISHSVQRPFNFNSRNFGLPARFMVNGNGRLATVLQLDLLLAEHRNDLRQHFRLHQFLFIEVDEQTEAVIQALDEANLK